MPDKRRLRVDWCSAQAAKYACRHWHYSKTTPVPPIVAIGVWENKKFIGCVMFSRGASSRLFAPYGLPQTQGCELTRIALSSHYTPVSRIIRIAIMFLKRKCPGIKLIVSFADPMEGHHGGVYQASGWIYVGQTAPSSSYMYRGRKLHSRQVSEKGFNIQFGQKTKTVKPSECEVIKCAGKYRYVYPLTKELKQKLAPKGLTYPKRATKATVGDQPAGGGALPTRALQFEGLQDGRWQKATSDQAEDFEGQPRQPKAQQERAATKGGLV